MLIQGFFSFYLIILTFAYVCVCVCVCVCTLYTHASKHSLRKPLIFGQNVFCTVVSLILLKRKKIGDNKKDMPFLLVWDKDQYSETFVVLFPHSCALQPTSVHLRQTSSVLPGPLSIVASVSLRLLYLLLYSEHIKPHWSFSFPFPISPVCVLPFVCDPCPLVLLHVFWLYNQHMQENMQFLGFWAWVTSLKMTFSCLLPLLVNDILSFFFVAE
jgi:hypothetical protein